MQTEKMNQSSSTHMFQPKEEPEIQDQSQYLQKIHLLESQNHTLQTQLMEICTKLDQTSDNLDFHQSLERNRDLEKEVLYLRTKNHDLSLALKENEGQKYELQKSLMNAETMSQRRESFI